jgi:hypothetical protein
MDQRKRIGEEIRMEEEDRTEEKEGEYSIICII